MSEEAKDFKFSVSYCHQLNISQCEVTEQEGRRRFVVNIYNSLGQFINKYVRVPVSSDFDHFRVIDSDGNITIIFNISNHYGGCWLFQKYWR